MRNIFDRDFKTVQCYFYIVDKLIKIHLPKLFKHFKQQNITTSFFTAQWFITLFTNAFEYTKHSYFVV